MQAQSNVRAPAQVPLSTQEVESYHRDGYLVPKYRLPPSDLTLLQELMANLVKKNPKLLNQPIASPHIPNGGSQGVVSTSKWLDIATHPDLLDIAQQLIGPDVILWGSTVFYKRAQKGPETPWHRDGAYWPIAPLATTSIWIAATPSTVDNGCLSIIPGSHRSREIGTHIKVDRDDVMFRATLADDELDKSRSVNIELEPGQMVVFDVYTVHGAGPNQGTLPRAGYSLRFMPATSRFNHDGGDASHLEDTPAASYATRALMLVRGSDRAGNDLARGHAALAR